MHNLNMVKRIVRQLQLPISNIKTVINLCLGQVPLWSPGTQQCRIGSYWLHALYAVFMWKL